MLFNRERIIAALLALAVVILYLPALQLGFVWLDHFEIVEGGMIVERWSDVTRRFIEPGNYAGYHRPLYDLMHSFDRAVWGLNPFGFHLSSVLLHAANAALIFSLSRRLGLGLEARLGITALWAVHPVNTAVAGLIHAKADLLVTFFMLCTAGLLDAGVRSEVARRRGVLIAFGMLAWAAALMSKETALILPLLFGLALPWKRLEPDPRKRWVAITGSLALSAVLLLLARRSGIVGLESPVSLFERLATFSTVFVRYVQKILIGGPLEMSDATTIWSALPALHRGAYAFAFFAVLFTLAFIGKRVPQSRPWLALFFVSLAPVSQVIPLLHFRADRFLYLPALGLLGATVLGAARLIEFARPRRAVTLDQAAWVLAFALTVLHLPQTRNRLDDFHNDETLFGPETQPPSDYREGLAALAADLDRQGRFDEATPYHARALQRDPRRLSYAEDATLVVNFSRNLLARREPERVLQLIEGFESSRPNLRERERDVLTYNRGVALHQLARYEQALPLLEAFAKKKDDASAWFLTGNAARESGAQERAKRAWSRYLELAPEAPDRARVEEFLRAQE